MQTRQSSRTPITVPGTVLSARGQEWRVHVDDLSTGGCRLDDPDGGLRLGELVKLSVGGVGPCVAEIAWRQSTRVGVEFVRPLSERVINAMGRSDWDAAASEYQATRHQSAVRRFV